MKQNCTARLMSWTISEIIVALTMKRYLKNWSTKFFLYLTVIGLVFQLVIVMRHRGDLFNIL